MDKLIEFIKNYEHNYSYEEALYDAKSEGLIKEYKYLGSEELDERRWGRTVLYVYEIDGTPVGIQVYVMHSDEGEDELEAVYVVEPYQVVETRWRKLND